MNKVVKYCTIVCCLLLLSNSCKKDKDEVPYVYVDIYLYTTDPSFSPLNAISGSTAIGGGSKGILIYRKSQTEFMVYDRHCTYQVAEGNQVVVDASGLLAVDAGCTSKFLITDGFPNSGPAVNALKKYQYTFDGTVLHIYN